MKPLYLLSIAILAFGCANPKSIISETDAKKIDLFNCTKEVDNLSPYIDDVSVIQLEANSVIVPTASKILTLDDKIFLFYGEEIVEFDQKGNYCRTIGKLGNGPEEFIHLGDICINAEQKEIICVTHKNEIIRYNITDGSFIKKTKLDIRGNTANGLLPLKNGGVAVYFSNPYMIDDHGYRLVSFNEDGEIIDKGMEAKDSDFCISMSFKPNVFQGYDNSYFLSYEFGSCYSYIAQDGDIKSSFYMDLGSKGLSKSYFKNASDPWMLIGDAFEDKGIKCPTALMTKNDIYVSAFGENSSVWNFITDGGKGIRWQSSSADPVPPVFFLAADKEYYYFLYLEYGHSETTDPLKRYVIDKTGLELKDNDNPAVIKVKFKI